ncbi:MAG: NAD(P)/FAD-dependent oxidoreductase [Euryarchaeota archaeon]|nr:NAD(P)/FAD-dependent oxidoreductase [Euryarchaeota archaeon]
MAETEHFDVVVIGGGSGLTAAYYADEAGKSVALVERWTDRLGGTCVNVGCIPSKQLIQSAEVMKTIRAADDFGITLDQSSVKVDMPAIFRAMRERRSKANEGTQGWVEDAFTPVFDEVRFVDEKTLETKDGKRTITGDKFFLAVGARAAIPPIDGLDKIPYRTNADIFDIKGQPKSLVILGGGYIGCEFGHFFSTLGTKVTIIDPSDHLLSEDDDIRTTFTKEFAKKVDLVTPYRAVAAVEEEGQYGFKVRKEDGDETRTVVGDMVLVATGRRPNTDTLDLDKTSVKTDDKGWVQVDDHMRTSHPDIYAYGDCIGQGMFKHTSSFEGEIAYRNAFGADLKMDYSANPHAIFSDPQIGAVGLTERECQEKGLDYKAVKRDYKDIAKGEIIGKPPGFAKLLVEKGTRRILGFHMLGPHAADLVHEVVVAMTAEGAKADLIKRSIHIHPTMPELIHTLFTEAVGSPYSDA